MIASDEIDWLAAQYALGAMSPGERRLLQARIAQDRSLATAIDAWESRLAPLSLREPGVAPSPHVLEGILASIAQQNISDQLQLAANSSRQSAKPTVAAGPRAVRLALAASVSILAIGIGAVLVDRLGQPLGQLTGMLEPAVQSSSADEPIRARTATFTAILDRSAGLLTIRRSTGEAPRADRMHVLWLIPGRDDDVIGLGRLETDGPTKVWIDAKLAQRLQQGRLLVTLEVDASVAKPRGPTIASGRIVTSQ